MSQLVKSEVRLSDVIRIALPMSTNAVASGDAARRTVNWVSLIMSCDNLSGQIEAGDIVLCPPSVQTGATEEEFLTFLNATAGLAAAAVVMFLPVSRAVTDAAEALDMPVLIIDGDTSLRDVHRNITALLVDRQTQISERGMQLYRELSEMSREGDGLYKMAQWLGKLTGKIVAIQDKRLEIQAIARPSGSLPLDDDSLLTALMEQENLPAVLRNRKAAAKATRSHWQQLLFPNHNVARLISPIISGDRARGYLSIIGAAGELDMLDAVAVEQGAAACALEMAKAKAVSEAKKALRGNFLEGILAGTIPSKEVERLSSRLDHETEQPHAVMTFRWVHSASAVSLRRVETTLNWLLSTNNRPTLVHIYGSDHICVFQSLRPNENLETAHRLARRLRSQLEADYPDQRMVAGLSGPVTTLIEWPQAHRQALQALEVGERLRLSELVDYNSLGVYRLLGQLDDVPAVHQFCDQVIGPLVEYDHEHRSNLVQTIEEYFNHHGNVSQTAEALFIHRNTLLYRLERIQELTGHDMSKSDMRLALHLALKLWQLRPET